MRDFSENNFDSLLKHINLNDVTIASNIANNLNFTYLSYFLTRNLFYTTIIDDYPFEISDKKSLLEAMYYQVKMITMHDLNWDAAQEGLSDALSNLSEFEGLVLIFRNGEVLKNKLPDEFKILSEIIHDINNHTIKKIRLII